VRTPANGTAKRGVRLLLVTLVGVLLFSYGQAAGTGLRSIWNGQGSQLQYTGFLEMAQYIHNHRLPHEIVIAALTAPVVIAGVPDEQIQFLAGPLPRSRPERYTRLAGDGVYRDFWLGSPSVVTATYLCDVMTANPGSWILVDTARLRSRSYYAGEMQQIIEAGSVVEASGENGAQARRVLSRELWTGELPEYC
jgi:hypothetical protein